MKTKWGHPPGRLPGVWLCADVKRRLRGLGTGAGGISRVSWAPFVHFPRWGAIRWVQGRVL